MTQQSDMDYTEAVMTGDLFKRAKIGSSTCECRNQTPCCYADRILERHLLKAALQQLVEAKDEKDANGDTPKYRELKAGAWERARELLARLNQTEAT